MDTVIFGTGKHFFKKMKSLYCRDRLFDFTERIVTFLDMDEKKQGNTLYGKMVMEPSDFFSKGIDFRAILISSIDFYDEIATSLKMKWNVPEEKIVGLDSYIEEQFSQDGFFKKYIGVDNVSSMAFPAGHYYSPIASLDEIDRDKERIFARRQPKDLAGISFNHTEQIALLEQFAMFYSEMPFQDEKSDQARYYYKNEWFSYGDAITLYSFLRCFRPKQIIEVGCGFSSAVMLDTNEQFFVSNPIKFTFIEPNLDRLFSLLRKHERDQVEIIEKQAQAVEMSKFEKLVAGDILFVDSSHVSKTGSDVNFFIFDVLPRLNPGVLIHFHDVFYPFEIPVHWIKEGRNWNETYMLRAFLYNNMDFKIKFWPNYLTAFNKNKLYSVFPLAEKNVGGSIWLERVC
ncbi:MAG: class I SAM-dependent methyltransferase [Clostridiales Family XIII bacterium]|nr:class I SAM-dependent methyltransferase [Clostridiales Family XIII bacterium]